MYIIIITIQTDGYVKGDLAIAMYNVHCTYSSRTSSSSPFRQMDMSKVSKLPFIWSSLKFTDIHLHSRDTRAMASFGSSWSFARSRGEFLTNQLNISWQQRNSTLANHFKNVVFRTAQLGFWEWRLDFIWLWTGFLQTYFVKKQVTGISRGLFQFPANYYQPRSLRKGELYGSHDSNDPSCLFIEESEGSAHTYLSHRWSLWWRFMMSMTTIIIDPLLHTR